jgi:sigma-B regulation protein RsbU (phosphoserine phosphatase)
MANLQACVRSRPVEEWRHPAKALESVNRHVYACSEAERFATLFFGAYSERTRLLRYVNCGHCPPILLRANGETRRLEPTATLLGAFAPWVGPEAEVMLDPGDRMLLYSDGVMETASASGEEFGEDRLIEVLRSSGAKSASAVVEEAMRGLTAFSGAGPADDVTLVAVHAT